MLAIIAGVIVIITAIFNDQTIGQVNMFYAALGLFFIHFGWDFMPSRMTISRKSG